MGGGSADIMTGMRFARVLLSSWFIGIALTFLFLIGYLTSFYPVVYLDLKIFDLLARFQGSGTTSDVVIVAIDNESLDRIDPWPWKRDRLASLIDGVHAEGAKTIGLHIPVSRKVADEGINDIRQLRTEIGKSRSKKRKDISEIYNSLLNIERKLDIDSKFVSAIKRSANVVLQSSIRKNSKNTDESEPAAWQLKGSVELKMAENKDTGYLKRAYSFIEEMGTTHPDRLEIVPPFRDAAVNAMSVGFIDIRPDKDDVVRKARIMAPYAGRYYLSMVLSLAMRSWGTTPKNLRYREGKGLQRGLVAGTHMIPVGPDMQLFTVFGKPENAVPHYSAADIMEGKIEKNALKGKTALIGLTAPGEARMYKTPAGDMADVDISALQVRNMLDDDMIVRPSWAPAVEMGAMLYFGLFLSLVIPMVRKCVGGIMIVMFLLTWFVIGAFLYMELGYWIMTGVPIFLALVGYGVLTAKHMITGSASSYRKSDGNTESNKMLGLSFQGQGMLDMAFDKFLQCPVEDESVKSLLYNLGLDFERKRMSNKAIAVYEHIMTRGEYKDTRERIQKLKGISGSNAGSGTERIEEGTMILDDESIRPTLGRYEIVRELGKGAMGTVYLGRDPKINRDVAIKTLKYEGMSDDRLREFKERFFTEAEAAGTLSHPNIVTVYDVGEEHDMAFIAMELLHGEDIASLLRSKGTFPVGEALSIISLVAGALDYAHSRGVVHRDIKPGNIMYGEDGNVKVTDFGIAKIMESSDSGTRTGDVFGTPSYMSPEQVSGKNVGSGSDIFSLGCVMYELLSGEKPFQGESIPEILKKVSKGKCRPLKEVMKPAPRCCVNIVEKMIQKSVRKRFKNCSEVVEHITACLKKIQG